MQSVCLSVFQVFIFLVFGLSVPLFPLFLLIHKILQFFFISNSHVSCVFIRFEDLVLVYVRMCPVLFCKRTVYLPF